MPRKSVKKERQSQIMESLKKCLLTKQFHEITIKDIAIKAGINHGMIYYLYKSKEDVLLHFIDYISDQYRTEFIEYINSHATHPLKGKALLRHATNFSNSRITLNKDLSKIFIEIWAIANHNIKVRKKLRNLYEQWISIVNDIFIKTRVSQDAAESFSNAMVSFYEGTALFSILFDWKDEQIKIILNQFQRKIIEMVEE